MKISARNVFSGTVNTVTVGAVNNQVVVELPGGLEVVSIITRSSSERLGLEAEKPVHAVIKASDVMIATD